MKNHVAQGTLNDAGDKYTVVWCKTVNATLPQFAALQCRDENFVEDSTLVFTVRHQNGLAVNVRIADLMKRPDGAKNPTGLTSKEYLVSWGVNVVAMSAADAAAECYASYFLHSDAVSLSVTDSEGHSELVKIGDLSMDRS